MKYVITGSLGHISKPLAQKLIAGGHEVTIISSNDSRSNDIKALGAKAAIGSVEDAAFLAKVFKGADGVYTMIPPKFDPKDWKKYIASIGANYAGAIRDAGVRNVVNLSSIGAHLPEGGGPVSGLFLAEKSLNELPGVNVLHLRPGFFYYNLLNLVGMAKGMGTVGGNYGQGTKMILVHTDDIAEVASKELTSLSFKGKSYRYISSDEKTTDEIANELGSAIGKPELKWVDFSDEQNKGGLLQAGLPEELARNYTEMGAAMRSGRMFEDYHSQNVSPVGKVKLKQFSAEFAKAYQGHG